MRKLSLPDKNCLQCKVTFGRSSCRQVSDYRTKKFCSRDCWRAHRVGPNHPNWKGGFKTRPDGYIRESATDKYLHRAVMERHLGRELKTEEHVHHIDGNPKNNEIINLMILSNSEHRKLECRIAPRINGIFARKQK